MGSMHGHVSFDWSLALECSLQFVAIVWTQTCPRRASLPFVDPFSICSCCVEQHAAVEDRPVFIQVCGSPCGPGSISNIMPLASPILVRCSEVYVTNLSSSFDSLFDSLCRATVRTRQASYMSCACAHV